MKTPKIEVINGFDICYIVSQNAICFGGLGKLNISEEETVVLLNHELQHWSQYLFLSDKEKEEMKFINFAIPHDERFIERTNPYYNNELTKKLLRNIKLERLREERRMNKGFEAFYYFEYCPGCYNGR